MHVANRSFAAPETRLLHNLSVLSARSDLQDFPMSEEAEVDVVPEARRS